MANYIKYNGLIMLSSENKDLKFEIICIPHNPLLQGYKTFFFFFLKTLTCIHSSSDHPTKAITSLI